MYVMWLKCITINIIIIYIAIITIIIIIIILHIIAIIITVIHIISIVYISIKSLRLYHITNSTLCKSIREATLGLKTLLILIHLAVSRGGDRRLWHYLLAVY